MLLACNAVDCMVLHFGINKTDAVIVGQKLVSAELVKGALLFKDDQSEFYISVSNLSMEKNIIFLT